LPISLGSTNNAQHRQKGAVYQGLVVEGVI
jgi:hypothetical protein